MTIKKIPDKSKSPELEKYRDLVLATVGYYGTAA
jgi:hypothetical protein